MTLEPFLLLGRVTRPHGLRGDLKLRAQIEDPSFLNGKNCFWEIDQKQIQKSLITRCAPYKPGVYILTLESVQDRTHADSFAGRDLYVNRADLPALPETQEMFYMVDLQGKAVWDEHNNDIGIIIGLENFGAGDVLVIEDPSGYRGLVPFYQTHVLSVDSSQAFILSDLGWSCFQLNKPKK